MSPVRDANLDLSPAATDLPLIATNVMSGSTVEINSTPLSGLAVKVNMGFTQGNTAVLTGTLNIIVHAASSTPVLSSDPIVGELRAPWVLAEADDDVNEIIPFATNYRYVACEYATTCVASDAMSVSTLEVFIVEGVGMDWSRSVEFH